MEKTTKTDNFLNAIKKYADNQRNTILSEVDSFKKEKIAEAKKKAKYDSEKLIKDKLEAKKNEQTSRVAKLTQEGQKKLFLERAEMTESIFKKAEEKLIEFTKTSKYSDLLKNYAENISALFDGKSCIIYVNERDMALADQIKAIFGEKAELCSDKTIKIGGLRGFCKEMSIVADETLDSKLNAQREWFFENSGLSVL